MQRRDGTASRPSSIPSRLLALVLCTAVASGALQMLQRPGRAVAGPAPTASATPSSTPTGTPSGTPSNTPTSTATGTASSTPSSSPTGTASGTPSSTPTGTASGTPSGTPTSTATGTASGTATGTATPTPTVTETVTVTPTITPTAEVGVALCSDGIDNNLNGLIDCADPSCAGREPCLAAAPAASPVLLLVLLATVSLVGLIQLRRRLR